MRNRLLLIAVSFAALGVLAGCNSQAEPLKTDESKQLHAPPGQPMPEAAREAMQRATQQGNSARTTGTGAGPGAPNTAPPTTR